MMPDMAKAMKWFYLVFMPLFLVIGLMALALSSDPWVSDPNVARSPGFSVYERTLEFDEPPPPIESDLLQGASVTRTSDSVELTGVPRVADLVGLLDHEQVRIPTGGGYAINGEEIKLVAQGIAYGEFPASSPGVSVRLPARYFAPDGRPLSESEVRRWEVADFRELPFLGRAPAVQVISQMPTNTAWKISSWSLFDPRTRMEVSRGYRHGEAGDRASVVTSLSRWHQGPTLVVMDVAYGPVEHVDLAARVGEVVRHGSWELHLGMLEGGEMDIMSPSLPPVFRLRSKPTRQQTMLVMVGSPWAHNLPVDLLAMGPDEQPLRVRHLRRSTRYLTAVIDAPRDVIETLRVVVYPNVRRLVFELPEIHGLPEENREVANLFDVHIPIYRVQHPRDFEHSLWQLLQLEAGPNRPQVHFPKVYFPRQFTNTTPRELLTEYLDHATNGTAYAKVDQQTGKLSFEVSLMDRVSAKIRSLFQ